MLNEQVVNMINKFIEVAIQYAMDGSKFTKDQNLAYFDYWVQNKAQNGDATSSDWLIMPPPSEAVEVVTP